MTWRSQGNDLYREMIESGVIKTGEHAAESKCTLVYGQMNEPPGARARVALTGPHLLVLAHASSVLTRLTHPVTACRSFPFMGC